MIKLQLVMAVVTFALWALCLVSAIGTPTDRVRNLPKLAWVVLIVLLPLVGSIAWLVAGRPQGSARRSAHEREQPAFPEHDRPGRSAAVDPQKHEEFLRRVRERAEEQRRRYEQSRRPKPPAPAQSDQAGPLGQTDEPGDPAATDTAER